MTQCDVSVFLTLINKINVSFFKALEERLAKRRQVIEMHMNDKDQEREEVDYRKEAHSKALDTLVEDGKMMDRQKHVRYQFLNNHQIHSHRSYA